MTPTYDQQRHPLSRRILHWVMALSILIMIGSGWRIYNASPIFDFLEFPEWATLGGDVDAALARHGDPGVASAIAYPSSTSIVVCTQSLFREPGLPAGA